MLSMMTTMKTKLTFTQALCAINDLNDCVILRSQILTVPSSLPVARQAVPGARAKPHTPRPTWSCTLRVMVREFLARTSYKDTWPFLLPLTKHSKCWLYKVIQMLSCSKTTP